MKHTPELDGLRGFAVLTVLCNHVVQHGLRLNHALWGIYGMEIFFVLSGFLISSIILNEWSDTGGFDFKRFYKRRLLRLMPGLLCMLTGITLLAFLSGDAYAQLITNSLLPIIFYYQNWHLLWTPPDRFFVGIFPTWSLGVEGQFYLFWPPILWLLLKFKTPKAGVVGTILIGICLSVYLNYSLLRSGGSSHPYLGTDTRAYEFLIGAFLAYLHYLGILGNIAHFRWTRMSGIGATIALLCVALPMDSEYILRFETKRMFLCTLCSALLIFYLLNWTTGYISAFFRNPFLRWSGKISYGLYLWNLPLIFFHRKYVPDFHITTDVFAIVTLSFLAGAFSCYAVEQPFLKPRKNLRS